jgi:hypothetical protein
VFALLVPGLLEQAVNNLTLMALSDLLQDCANKFVTANSHDITRMLPGCQHKVVTILLYQACNGLVRTTLQQV